MLIVVAYDVSTADVQGQRRLRKVAKVCTNKGQRVQNSVFECLVDGSEYKELKHQLAKIIDVKQDSLRFYNLGNEYWRRLETLGKDESYDPQDTLFV